MIDPDQCWQFIQPYARSTHEIVERLRVTIGIATGLQAGGAITTNCIDYELACLQVFIATEKLAASIAALHNLPDRELVFAGEAPGWQLEPLAVLPMPVDIKEGGVRLRRSDFVFPDEFRRLRDEARDALQIDSVLSLEEPVPVDHVRSAADKLYAWLHSHMMVLPQLAAIAIVEHCDDEFNCRFMPIDDIKVPTSPKGPIDERR